MAVALFGTPVAQFFDNNGNPLAGGKLYTYASTTTTPLAAYTDSGGLTAHTNPIVLNSRGEPNTGGGLWLLIGSAYRLVLKDATDATTFWTIDGVQVLPNSNPTLIDDYSATVAQSNLMIDPGETGSEVLPANLAEELAQHRFIFAEMKGTASWRTSNTLRQSDIGIGTYDTLVGWPPSATTEYQWRILVPAGFINSAPMAVRVYVSSTVALGVVRFAYQYTLIRHATLLAASGYSIVTLTPAVANTSYLVSLSVLAPAYQAGDVINLQLQRTGTDVGDTNTGTASFRGGYLECTAVASRSG